MTSSMLLALLVAAGIKAPSAFAVCSPGTYTLSSGGCADCPGGTYTETPTAAALSSCGKLLPHTREHLHSVRHWHVRELGGVELHILPRRELQQVCRPGELPLLPRRPVPRKHGVYGVQRLSCRLLLPSGGGHHHHLPWRLVLRGEGVNLLVVPSGLLLPRGLCRRL